MRASIIASLLILYGCGQGVTVPITDPTALGCIVSGTGNSVNCGTGNSIVVVQPTPAPSATPVGPADCRVDYLVGNGPDFIPMNGEAKFDLTPMQTYVDGQGQTQTRKVADACNEPRAGEVDWSSSNPSAFPVVGSGFAASGKRVGSGVVTVTAAFAGRTKLWQIQ